MTTVLPRATLADLAQYQGKAELVGGRIVAFMPTGRRPNRVAGNIYFSLRLYERQSGGGEAYTDNVGFVVPELVSGRETFSPDVSFYRGTQGTNAMRFIEGAPTLAVEVRSENDYSSAAELEQEAKRADYFQAGTLVVWDVDPVHEVIDCYHASAPTQPLRFVRGQIAAAEPAVPGWTLAVADVFA